MSARNFIKLRGELADDRKVFTAANRLDISRDAAFGMLARWLLWVDANCPTPNTGLTFEQVGELMGHAEFAGALEEIGWIGYNDDDRIFVCEFEKYLEPTAKQRQLAAERIAAHRWGKKPAKKGTVKKKGGKQ